MSQVYRKIASIADPTAFLLGRDFSACIGLVPKRQIERGQRPARVLVILVEAIKTR